MGPNDICTTCFAPIYIAPAGGTGGTVPTPMPASRTIKR
jgi:hypothetical protein